jgi:hypothetical protein
MTLRCAGSHGYLRLVTSRFPSLAQYRPEKAKKMSGAVTFNRLRANKH